MLKVKTVAIAAPLTLAFVSVLTLSGCATATPVMTPSGGQGFTINCSVTDDMGSCYKKAGELCGSNGYKIFAQHDKSVGLFTSADKTMVVQCKSPSTSKG